MTRFLSACAVLSIALAVPWITGRAEAAPSPAVVATPQPGILDVTTGDLPKASLVAVEIRKGTIAPGAATIWHTHPSPLFVYVENGSGSWE